MSTLFISDLDGTLVDQRAELSAYSRENLLEMLNAGLPFTVASARSIVSIQQMLQGLPIKLPVICFNGAFLSDFTTGKHHIVHGIRSDVATGIYELLPEFNCVPYIATFDGTDERVYFDQVINAGMRWYLQEREARADPRWRKTDRLADALTEDVIAMTMIHRKEVLDDLESAIRERYDDAVEIHHFENEYSPGWYWLTVHDVRATKDQAINSMRQLLGLEDHRVVVFGDNRNDIKMFRAADRAIAVANAIDEVKHHAQEVIGPNLEDSVVKYLRQNWKAGPRNVVPSEFINGGKH
ncbi:MAG: HAD-IIB family hydrolase [Pseudohongiellaceae bacterium]